MSNRTLAASALALSAHLLLGLAQPAVAQKPGETAASAAPASAPTEEQAQDDRSDAIAKGDNTRQWLGGQANRKQASRNRQTLSGKVMTEVNERYVKSFSDPIPSTLTLRPESNLSR